MRMPSDADLHLPLDASLLFP
ncbi:MAG: hypothetical protein RLZZ253_2091, partial [Verrucomicrobiota bacterium]